MSGQDILPILNEKEREFNRDEQHPELHGAPFKWDYCESGRVRWKGSRAGRYAYNRYRLRYASGFEYTPRPWYRTNRKKRGRITTLIVPTNPVEITMPSITKLIGEPIVPKPMRLFAYRYPVTYYGGRYRVGDAIEHISSPMPKTINVGESTTPNKLMAESKRLSHANITSRLPQRKSWDKDDHNYKLDKMYPKYKEYVDHVVLTIASDFIDDTLKNIFTSSKPNKYGFKPNYLGSFGDPYREDDNDDYGDDYSY